MSFASVELISSHWLRDSLLLVFSSLSPHVHSKWLNRIETAAKSNLKRFLNINWRRSEAKRPNWNGNEMRLMRSTKHTKRPSLFLSPSLATGWRASHQREHDIKHSERVSGSPPHPLSRHHATQSRSKLHRQHHWYAHRRLFCFLAFSLPMNPLRNCNSKWRSAICQSLGRSMRWCVLFAIVKLETVVRVPSRIAWLME